MSRVSISILICTYGDEVWRKLALRRANPSTHGQSADEVKAIHLTEGPAGIAPSLAQVRNMAAEMATGSHLCFLDADDELAPGYIAAMRQAASDSPQALLYPAVQYVTAEQEQEPVMLGAGRPLIDLNRAVIGSLVPRRLFLDVGGFGEEPIYEDWALWLRCSQYVPLIGVPDAIYRAHARLKSRNAGPLAAEWYRRIREEHGALQGATS